MLRRRGEFGALVSSGRTRPSILLPGIGRAVRLYGYSTRDSQREQLSQKFQVYEAFLRERAAGPAEPGAR